MLNAYFKRKMLLFGMLFSLPFSALMATNSLNCEAKVECPSSQITLFTLSVGVPNIPGGNAPGYFWAVALDCDINSIPFQIKIEQDDDPDFETFIDTIWVDQLEYQTPKRIDFEFEMPDDFTQTYSYNPTPFLSMEVSLLEESEHIAETLRNDYEIRFPEYSISYTCPENNPTPGGTLTYHFDLVNQGETTSYPTKMGIFQKRGSWAFYPGAELFGTKLIPALETGEVYSDSLTITLPDNFRFPGMGTHTASWEELYFGVQKNSSFEEIALNCGKTNAEIEVFLNTPSLAYDELGEIEYTVNIVNHGPDVAHNLRPTIAKFWDSDGELLNPLNPSHGEIWPMDYYNARIWYIETLEVGDTATANIQMFVGPNDFYEPGRFTHSEKDIEVRVSSSYVNDTIPENNVDQLHFYWENFSNVRTRLTLEASTSVYSYGQEIGYKLSLYNHGPDTGRDFVVSFGLPDGLVPLSQQIHQGEYNELTREWHIETLPAGETATMRLVGKAKIENTPILAFAHILSSASADWSNDYGVTDCDLNSDIDPYELLHCNASYYNGVWHVVDEDEALVLIEPVDEFQLDLPEARIDNEQHFQLWPNPVGEKLRLQYNLEIPVQKLTLVNIHGQVVKEIANYSENALEVNDLPEGVYILSLHTAEGLLSRRFVKR